MRARGLLRLPLYKVPLPAGGQGFNLLQALLDSAKVIGSVCTSDASTNTQEDIVGRATLQLTSVDQRYISKHNRGSCDSLVAGRLADLQRDSEERIKIQVEAQVACSRYHVH